MYCNEYGYHFPGSVETSVNQRGNGTYGYHGGKRGRSLVGGSMCRFCQNFLLMQESDSDVTVNILNVDPVKGAAGCSIAS